MDHFYFIITILLFFLRKNIQYTIKDRFYLISRGKLQIIINKFLPYEMNNTITLNNRIVRAFIITDAN